MVFYFTGTGNSLYAAKMLDHETVSIPQALKSGGRIWRGDRIGIVCPIYGHEMPAMVKEFIRRTEFCTTYFYVILTYGSRHANAVELAQGVLSENARQADYIRTLLMADNFLPYFDMEEQKSLDKNVEGQLSAIRADIDAGRHYIEPVTAEDHMAHEDYRKRVHGAPETFWADFTVTSKCIGCGICTKVCPAGCFHLAGQRAYRTKDKCQACYACIQACPGMAIRFRRNCGYTEKNPEAHYRNEHVSLTEIVRANQQSIPVRRKTGSAAI